MVDLIKFILTNISQNEIEPNIETIIFNIERIFLPEIILFPIVASFLSIFLVLTAIYLSNPTHDKANKRKRKNYLNMALKMGILTGLISAIITIILYQPSWTSGAIRRVVAWSIIGLGIGLAEGLCWHFLTTEGANILTKDRLIKSPVFGFLAGLVAAFLIELIRQKIQLGGYEEPLGFIILGTCLGLSLTFSTTPAYQVALRAGRGFGISYKSLNNQQSYPKITDSSKSNLGLTFVPFKCLQKRKEEDPTKENLIEEGLSIQLPSKNKSTIVIGSAEESHIFLPGIPAKAAELILEKKQWKIKCFSPRKVELQTKKLSINDSLELHHNQILTFYYEKANEKFYRFIFYDRFLDPST
ncbi:MAG: hypothetical protein QNJ33_14725 [Crocosphaera sp.]|nr:hypothetical protein [Crocosphaera sp.]